MVIFSIAACFKFPVLGGLFPRQKGWNALPKLGLSRPTWKNLVVKIKLVHLPHFVGVNNPKKTNPPIDLKSTTRQLTLQGNSNISLFRLYYALLNKHLFPAFPFAGICYIYIPSRELTYPPDFWHIWRLFSFSPRWNMYPFPGGYIYIWDSLKVNDGNDTHTQTYPPVQRPEVRG